MRKVPMILLMSLAMASGVYAQGASGGVTMSTDPAKAAAVERHAQEIKSREAQQTQAQPAAKKASSKKSNPQAKHTTSKKSNPQAKHESSGAKPVAKK